MSKIETIFYYSIDDENDANWFFGNSPFKKWFILENILYEPNGNIIKRFINEEKLIKRITVLHTQDTFSDNGIIRRIGLLIEKN